MRLARCVLVLALCATAVASCSAAPGVFLSLTANGNEVPGDSSVVSLGRAGTIECLSFDMGLTQSRGPGGQATGRHSYLPITVTKRLDRASVLLLKALTNNEPCEGEFRFFAPGASGAERHVYTIAIQGAYLTSVRQFVDPQATEPGGLPALLEEVSFVFRGITWTWQDGGIEHSDGEVQTTALPVTPGEGPQPGQPGAQPLRPALRLPDARRIGPQQ
jgi:type VI secretion system secreted protein Hcp